MAAKNTGTNTKASI